MQAVCARIGSDAELGMVAWREQMLLQTDGPTVEFGFKQPLADAMAGSDGLACGHIRRGAGCWCCRKRLPDCIDRARAIHAGRSNRRMVAVAGARGAGELHGRRTRGRDRRDG